MNYTNEQKINYIKYLSNRVGLNRRLFASLRGKQKQLTEQHYENSHTKAGKCFLGGMGNAFNKQSQVFGV